uniref:ABC transporter related protein n=1 Tax=Rubinisphaera brasiliensis (strain ATCC 49424 / DSM 5305 / JCM 21570 / IAM 15109 / NBRC 103401 / IFAM 1448) TaxID=756272 RepID=F0SMM8_RUBBR|nr:ABC transporter related protein [Rubinisphaera brasiliensis DSM 5305]
MRQILISLARYLLIVFTFCCWWVGITALLLMFFADPRIVLAVSIFHITLAVLLTYVVVKMRTTSEV